MDKSRVAIVTGSFDPITAGHVGIVRRAAALFDTLYVVGLTNETKMYRFTPEERLEMIRLATADVDARIVADVYEGMTADYMHSHGITTIVRGIRNGADLAYERALAAAMREADPAFETVFLLADEATLTVSSTAVREALLTGESLSALLPPAVESYIRSRKRQV